MPLFSFPAFLIESWRLTGWVLSPFLKKYLTSKLIAKGSTSSRIHERYGKPSPPPPAFFTTSHKRLWIHAASVGEARSTFPLIEALFQKDPHLSILVTTATETGAETCASHPAFGTRLFHQFIPYDTPLWVHRFLDYWQPSGALFIESEFWPTIITACQKRAIPWMVANARLSDRSFRRWRRFTPLLRYLLSGAAWIAPRSDEDHQRFAALGLSQLVETGDLKEDSPPLPSIKSEEKRLRTLIGTRPVFVAASTHEGEEELIVRAVQQAAQTQPNILAIIVPRHPERGAALAQTFHAPRRSEGQDFSDTHHLWIADTLGELGLFYRLADKVFLGNSLCRPGEGHNPFEPLRLQCPTAVGPYMQNWKQACQKLHSSLTHIHDISSLSAWITAASPAVSVCNKKQTTTQLLSVRIMDTIFSHSPPS